MAFAKLFEPVRIGRMTIKNRIVFPPMGTNYAAEDGGVTERMVRYYQERAKGGAGLVIVEATCVDSQIGRTIVRQPCIDHDKFIAGLGELAGAIKQNGARAAIQLLHAGRVARFVAPGLRPVGPSAVAAAGFAPPSELTRTQIGEIVARFAAAAGRAAAAGFQGIEVHGAHGYLLAQFLSRAANQRHDEYGGEMGNRARLLLDVMAAVRQSVGRQFPVWVRLNGREYGVENGFTVAEAQQVARMVQEAGADAIHVSAHPIAAHRFYPLGEPPGNMVHLARAIKDVVQVPVIAVSRITPEIGESALRRNKADLVAMGKALIADPHLPNKLASGSNSDITPCIRCLYCHETLRELNDNGSVRCAVNVMAGRELENSIAKAAVKKSVVVAGGGPAGMEAARVARLRGHEVTLFEKADCLGGLLRVASVPSYKDGIRDLREYLASEVARLGVQIRLGETATRETVLQSGPDAVICAAGSVPRIPEIDGIEACGLPSAVDVLSGSAPVGDSVVIIGGGLVGVETADFLAGLGKSVTIVEMLDEVGAGLGPIARKALLRRLQNHGIVPLTGVRCERVTPKGLVILTRDGAERTLEADSIVAAVGATPDLALFNALKGSGVAVYRVGDCYQPRRILEAIEDGSRVARLI